MLGAVFWGGTQEMIGGVTDNVAGESRLSKRE